jgi:4-hydroxy-tetrahydrodipicolinate reductase
MSGRDTQEKVVRVIGYGVGPIGGEALRHALRTPWIRVVGAIDNDPAKAGRDLGEVLDLGQALDIGVAGNASACLARLPADVVIHCAGSRLPAIRDHLMACLAAGLPVVSSAEELLFPAFRHPALAEEIDRMARERGVAVLGTGVNPGFVMDLLPLVCTGVCRDVRRIEVERVVDAGTRRLPLQRKVGAGLTPGEFREEVEAGRLGHVGLVDSLAFVADALGWAIGEVKESIDPILAEADVQTA